MNTVVRVPPACLSTACAAFFVEGALRASKPVPACKRERSESKNAGTEKAKAMHRETEGRKDKEDNRATRRKRRDREDRGARRVEVEKERADAAFRTCAAAAGTALGFATGDSGLEGLRGGSAVGRGGGFCGGTLGGGIAGGAYMNPKQKEHTERAQEEWKSENE